MPKKWRPEYGDKYFHIQGNGGIIKFTWEDLMVDMKIFNFGNCFRTRAEAEMALKKIKAILKRGEIK